MLCIKVILNFFSVEYLLHYNDLIMLCRPVAQPPPISSLHQRLNPSVYGPHFQHKSTDNSEHNRSSSSDSEARSSPQNRLPLNGVSSHNSESNNVHISINRRIGLPAAFFFPENQTTPPDLNGDTSSSKRRPFSQDETQLLNLEIPSSESETYSPKGSLNSSTTATEKTSKFLLKCMHSIT